MSIQYHDQPNTVTVAADRSTVENTDQPATVDISTTETTVTVVSGIGAIGPQGPTGPEGPQGPPGAIASLTVSSPLASTGGSSPNLSLGVVPVTYGGTGVGSLTGYVYGNGTSAFSASTSIPNSAVTGLGTMALQNANSITVTGGYLSNVSEEVSCSNRTGTAIAKGSAVYLIGAHGDVPEIALADASGESTAARTLGIAVESIPDAGVGRVCFSGLLTGINTQSLTEGALVWLSETAGELTTTRPTQPAHGVFMGVCVKQAPGGAGRLFVSVSNGQELDELHDVLITSPTAGQIFKRNTGNTLWVNASPASLTATNDTNVTLTLGGNASTALVNDASLTLGWTGTLASSRLNANVVQSVSNDTNVTGSINSQAMTLGWMGQLAVGRGGTGASSLSGYLVGNGGSAFTAVSSIPGSAISGNISGNAANVTGTVAVGNGGTGATSLTGYLVGNGTSAFTAVSSIPNTAISGLGTMSTQNANNVAITGGSATSLALVTVAAGSVGSPSIAAQNDTATGMYWPSSATLALTTNGTNRLQMLSDGSAVFGSGDITATPVGNILRAPRGSGTDITGGTLTFDAGNGTGTGGSGSIIFRTAAAGSTGTTANTITERLKIDKNGNVLLNQPSVAAALSMIVSSGAPNGTRGVRIFDNAGLINAWESGSADDSYIGTRSAHAFNIRAGNTDRLRLTSGGDVAIGAAAKLYVDGTTATGDTYLHESSANNLSFVTGGTERLRLTSSGDTAIPATAKLYLDGVAGTGNTYLQESAADTLSTVIGGVDRFRIDGTTFTSINSAGNNTFDLWSTASTILRLARYSDDANNTIIQQRKARGTISSPTAVAAGDAIGANQFQAYGGTNWRTLAVIRSDISSFTSDTDMTAHLSFSTTNAGSAAVERLRLTGFGDLAISTNRKLLLDAVAATGDTYLTEASANNIAIYTGGAERVRIDGSGNVGVAATTFGSSAANVFAVKNGTEPTSGPADTVQIYSVDRSAGNTIPAIYCEGTGVTDAGITSTTVTHKIALKVNGTVYYLLATTNAT